MQSLTIIFEFANTDDLKNYPTGDYTNYPDEKFNFSIATYGYILYKLQEKIYKDSGGYLSSFIVNLLDAIVKLRSSSEIVYVDSMDGDAGLKIEFATNPKLMNNTKITIYAGTKTIAKKQITFSEFEQLVFNTVDNFCSYLRSINPQLEYDTHYKHILDLQKKLFLPN